MDKTTNKVDQDLLAFISECRDLLDEIEPRLIEIGDAVELRKRPDRETVDFLFRGFHTIKGTAAFYQLDHVVDIAHKAETLLEHFRSGNEKLSGACTDLLCQACDVIEFIFRGIESMDPVKNDDERICSIIAGFSDCINACNANDITEKNVNVYESYDSAMVSSENEFQPGQSGDEAGKIGNSIRIFVEECLEITKKIEAIRQPFSRKDMDSRKVMDSLEVMADGAVFLGFDRITRQLEIPLTLLRTIEREKREPRSDEHTSIKKALEMFDRLLKRVGRTGKESEKEQSLSDHEKYAGSIQEPVTVAGPQGFVAIQDGKGSKPPDMRTLYYEECLSCLESLAETTNRLVKNRKDPDCREYILHAFHTIKGGSGLVNQADMYQVTKKAGECLSEVFSSGRELDDWDINALNYVVDQMSQAVSRMIKGETGLGIETASLVYILDSMKEGLSLDRKERQIDFTNLRMPGKTPLSGEANQKFQCLEKDEKDQDLFTPDEKASPMPLKGHHLYGHSPETGLLWGGERRQARRVDIRVSIEKLDELINLVGELVVAENMVVNNPDVHDRGFENFERAGAHLRKIIRDLQEVALAVRMVPISGIFRKMIRLVHDLSRKSGKKIRLDIIGEETEIDKTVFELIADPLVHLIRNAIDHGIERHENSESKEDDGRIVIEARHEGGKVLVIVNDDGKGLDTQRIYEKAFSDGILSAGREFYSDQEINSLIFRPGFSTHDTVTDISGRGVGMDVVKKNMDRIKGQVHVHSEPGRGTTFALSIPLTLSILEGMLVRVGRSCYTIPVLSIRETVIIGKENTTEIMDGQEVVNLRGHLIPVIRLDRVYGHAWGTVKKTRNLMVVMEHNQDRIGVLIDEIIGEQQTVIKSMSVYMNPVMGISGCAILSDGEVSLILDVGGLIQRVRAGTHTRDTALAV